MKIIPHMHRAQSHRRNTKYLKRTKGSMSSIKGVSHFARRAKRRLFCKLQLWMWRKRREKCRFAIFRVKKQACGVGSGSCLAVTTRRRRNKSDAGGQSCLLKLCQPDRRSEASPASGLPHNVVSADVITSPSPKTETWPHLSDVTDPLKCSLSAFGLTAHLEERGTLEPPESSKVDCASEQSTSARPGQNQAADMRTDEKITNTKTDDSLKVSTKDIHEFLDGFYRVYGSFIPLQKSDVLKHLERKFNCNFSDRKNGIFPEVARCRTAIMQKPVPSFHVVYKKHTLTLDDLSTLADQNWLNDQVMNMYGELIMESADHKVHFLNSFFHRQLMTKGYDGVKRWTKQVDLFSKSLILVPIHLEVHWCLVTADNVGKKICIYDSQGNALQKVARNILKYLMTEAKEKKQTAFENGWAVSFDEKIPQQTNENDCGVFVLEYSRCLALGKPLQFSQKDIPKIRKRIYKELCDCKLHEQS